MVPNATLKDSIVCIMGLGYVGLPLAEAFSKHFKVIGFDIDENRVKELEINHSNLEFTSDPSKIKQGDFVIIAVPTPITESKEPDLSYVQSAAEIVGRNLKKGAIVVNESTVYPGVTEEIICLILEKESGLKLGKDFKIGYSPERINPGDEDHTLDEIPKVVSGIDEESKRLLAALYGEITTVYIAKDIKTAEAAKVIENVQRDLNIALMNELSIIFNKMGLDTKSVLDAAATKWNFHRYEPGMVGGHCIPVDPYYLVYKAKKLGYYPQVILAGRSINDYMPEHVVNLTIRGLVDAKKIIRDAKVLIMGLTYKENVPDIRETPAKTLIKELKSYGIDIYGFDPLLKTDNIQKEFQITPVADIKHLKSIDAIIRSLSHEIFKPITLDTLHKISNEKPVLIDIRGVFDMEEAEDKGFCYKRL